ncbi:MAG: hypothetical protein ACR2QJ_03035 [Geminicoccaceae bacterium]
MAPPKITAKKCKICGGVLASDQKKCLHCGVSDPIKKDESPLWPWALFMSFIVILLML